MCCSGYAILQHLLCPEFDPPGTLLFKTLSEFYIFYSKKWSYIFGTPENFFQDPPLLEGKGWESFEKRNKQVEEIEYFEKGELWMVHFFTIQNPSNLEELSNRIREYFGGFCRVYMISSNLIHVFIEFLKLKIY